MSLYIYLHLVSILTIACNVNVFIYISSSGFTSHFTTISGKNSSRAGLSRIVPIKFVNSSSAGSKKKLHFIFSEETPLHLFYECSKTSSLWIELQLCLENKILLPSITPQSAIFGFIDITENKILLNHLLLIFKFSLYNARKTGNINIENLKASIYNIKNVEREISKDNPKKKMKYKKKWHLIPQVMQINFAKKGGWEGGFY